MTERDIKRKFELIRQALREERISYGELLFLQQNRKHIAPDDIELLEAINFEGAKQW